MKRLLQHSIFFVSGVLLSQQLLALGLGELTLHSALNQPLNADIELIDRNKLSDSDIQSQLATQADFDRAGVERAFFLSNIRFKVEGQRIRLTSDKPVNEPFLNFLVELNWPQGRTLREYTILLDPPTFEEENYRQLKITQPATVETQHAVANASVKNDRWAEPATPGSYKVQKYDTLWEIALETRPNSSITPQQMMLAIQQQNPHAFINGNINRLKSHTVLTLPTEAQAKKMTRAAAMAEVAAQNAAFKSGKAQIDATGMARNSAKSATANQQGGEVRLLANANKDVKANRSSGETGGQQANEVLENDLAIALEQVDEGQRANAELRQRLDSLQEQIDTLTQLIQLKDEQLATMQTGAQKIQSNKTETPVLNEEERRARTAAVLDEPASEDADLIAQILQELQENPEIPAAIGGVLLLLLLLALRLAKKRKASEQQAEEGNEKPLTAEEAKLHELQNDEVTGVLIATPLVAGATDESVEDQEVYLDSFDSGDVEDDEENVELEQNVEAEPEKEFDYGDEDLDFTMDEALANELAEELGLEVSESKVTSIAPTEDIPTLEMSDEINLEDDGLELDDVLLEEEFDAGEAEPSVDTGNVSDEDVLEVDFDLNADEDTTALEDLENLHSEEFTALDEFAGFDTKDLVFEHESEEAAGSQTSSNNDDEIEFTTAFDLEDLPSELTSRDELPLVAEDDDLAEFDLDLDLDTLLQADNSEEDADFSGSDESATKLDLARAYIEMSEADGARELLEEVLQQGSDEQKAEAQELLNNL